MLSACKTHNLGGNNFGGRSDECNIYTGDFLANTFNPADDSNFVGGIDWDAAWEPTTRDATQAGSDMDYVGVWVEIDQDTFSGFSATHGPTPTTSSSASNRRPSTDARRTVQPAQE